MYCLCSQKNRKALEKVSKLRSELDALPEPVTRLNTLVPTFLSACSCMGVLLFWLCVRSAPDIGTHVSRLRNRGSSLHPLLLIPLSQTLATSPRIRMVRLNIGRL